MLLLKSIDTLKIQSHTDCLSAPWRTPVTRAGRSEIRSMNRFFCGSQVLGDLQPSRNLYIGAAADLLSGMIACTVRSVQSLTVFCCSMILHGPHGESICLRSLSTSKRRPGAPRVERGADHAAWPPRLCWRGWRGHRIRASAAWYGRSVVSQRGDTMNMQKIIETRTVKKFDVLLPQLST